MLYHIGVVGLVVVVCVGRVPVNDLGNGGQSPLPDIEILNEHVPMLETVLPTLELCIATLPGLAWVALTVNTWPIIDASLVAQAQRDPGHTCGAERRFVHKECQGIGWIYPVLDAQVVQGLALPTGG